MSDSFNRNPNAICDFCGRDFYSHPGENGNRTRCCSRDCQCRKLHSLGIKKYYKCIEEERNIYSLKNWIYNEYNNFHKTMEEIGNNLGVSKSLISTWCKTWNIKTNNEYKKTCRLCGMTYKSFHNRSMFCSESCRTKYRYKHLGEDIKNKLRLEGSIRSRKSNETQTYEQKKIKWDKANKKKSERYFGEKYRTLNQEEIKVIKQTSAKAKYIARMNTPYMRMKGSLYRRLNHLIKGYSKDAHMQDYLGCSFRFLKEYLGNKFLDNMTWDNYGKGGWVIDHIIPCCNFDLSKEADRYKCFNYKNLQPLWEKDNTRKGGKMPDGTFIYSRENFRIKNNSLIEAQSRGVKYE